LAWMRYRWPRSTPRRLVLRFSGSLRSTIATTAGSADRGQRVERANPYCYYLGIAA
jgi:hypothetical protein